MEPVPSTDFNVDDAFNLDSIKIVVPPRFTDWRDALQEIAGRHDLANVFRSFICLSACALSLQLREKEYMEEIVRWDKEEQTLFTIAFGLFIEEAEENPFIDMLGSFYEDNCQSKSTATRSGEYYTPEVLCDAMAHMLWSEDIMPKDHPLTVQEPACGSGRMILALAKVMTEAKIPPIHMRAQCIDVSKTGCDMCYINTTIWGIPAEIVHGNALSNECWCRWKNIFYYQSFAYSP